jgi:predicted RNA binding protein YcfA (HicA-like mRNA interferase family)
MVGPFLRFVPMPCKEAKRALGNLGFTHYKTKGSHEHWKKVVGGCMFKVTLDCHHGEVKAKDVRSMVGQAGVTRKEFLSAREGSTAEPASHVALQEG